MVLLVLQLHVSFSILLFVGSTLPYRGGWMGGRVIEYVSVIKRVLIMMLVIIEMLFDYLGVMVLRLVFLDFTRLTTDYNSNWF